MIKNFDYLRELKLIRSKIEKKFKTVLNSGNLILGSEVEEFENNFSKFLGVKYGIGVGNCTDALFIALKALDIGYGDEVITVSNTAIPTITAIVNSGARPRFVDVGEDYLMDCSKIVKLINKKTKAILPVHLYGNTCDMKKIITIAKKYNLKIIEDCAQSTGSIYKNKKTGTFGDIGCFSFYPTKILGGFGDGGFISTKNKYLYEKMKRIRYMGIEVKKNLRSNLYKAVEHGTNSRLDELQAGLLNIRLRKLDYYIKIRLKNARLYSHYLKNTDLILPNIYTNNQNVYYEYVVKHKNRKKILDFLSKKKIFLKVTYPIPIHKMKPYKKWFDPSKDKLKITEKNSNQIFSLPVYPGIKKNEIKKICKNLKIILRK